MSIGQPNPFRRRRPLLLDGATGTELERRGYRTALPLWTALAVRDATEMLGAVHDGYVAAGADILTACTFRTNRYTLAKRGLGGQASDLSREALALARDCARRASRHVLVAGSIAPLEDCYHPELTPPEGLLEREHAAHAENLAASGVDLVLVESMPTAREALAAACAAVATGLVAVVSLLVGPGGTLFDGTPLGPALERLAALPIALLAVNCAPLDWCEEAMGALAATGLAFGAYANSGTPDGSFGGVPSPLSPPAYAEAARGWIARGASMIGGCCGTGPEHIAALRGVIDEGSAA
jgi:S-methylmethionine-dependent homocysteine/selenocysteine methylase